MIPLLSMACALLIAGSSAAAYFAVASGGGPLGRALSLYERRIQRHATFLMLDFGGPHIARAQLVLVSALVVLLLATQAIGFGAMALFATAVPPFVLWKRHLARVSALERQLDAWLLMLANAIKSTPSIGEAIASTVHLLPKPFNQEVDLIVKELRLGVPLDRALSHSGRRIGSSSVSAAFTLVLVARQTGGDLAHTLETAAAALRETARLEGVLRTKTAEGRGQVVVLSLVPFVLCAVIAWLDPSWFEPLTHHHLGRGILAVCGIAWLVAALWAHHIVGAEL